MKKILTTVSALLLTLSLVGCGSAKEEDRVLFQDENVVVSVVQGDAIAENLTENTIYLDHKWFVGKESLDKITPLKPNSTTKLTNHDKESNIYYRMGGK